MNLKFWIGLVISCVFLYLAFYHIDLHLLYQSLKSIKFTLLIPIILMTYTLYVIRALRWSHLLKPIKRMGFGSLFSSTVIGFAANCVLPARLGEFIRANYIGEMENISKSSSLATIVIERLLDISVILLLFLFVVLFTHFPGNNQTMKTLKISGLIVLITWICAVILLVLIKVKTQNFIKTAESFLSFLPRKIREKIIGILRDFSQGLVLVKGPGQLVVVILYSVSLWCLFVFQVYVIGISMDVYLPFLAPFFIVTLVCFSVAIPSAPGYIGTFHLACQYSLVLYGFSHEKALGLAIVLHAAGFIPTIALGLVIFLMHHLSIYNLTGGRVSLKNKKKLDI